MMLLQYSVALRKGISFTQEWQISCSTLQRDLPIPPTFHVWSKGDVHPVPLLVEFVNGITLGEDTERPNDVWRCVSEVAGDVGVGL